MATKDEAKRYLNDCAPEQCFWVNNGPILRNIEELSNTLPEMSSDVFGHHVGADKNDFGNWIRDVIGDQKLANDILSSRNKESMAKKVKARVNALKKKVG